MTGCKHKYFLFVTGVYKCCHCGLNFVKENWWPYALVRKVS